MIFAVAIIYYNPDSDVFKRLETYTKCFEKVLIIDNSDSIKQHPDFSINKNLVYVDMHGNLGMSKAIEYSLNWAYENKVDILLTMDQDSDFPLESMEYMKNFIRKHYKSNIAVYAPNFCKLYFNRKKKQLVADSPYYDLGKNQYMDFCITSGSFCNVGILKQFLPLDDYFISYVDNDLCTSLCLKGYRLLLAGKAMLYQQVGGCVTDTWVNKKLRILHHSDIRYYYMTRNNFFYRQKYRKFKKIRYWSYMLLLRTIFNIVISEPDKARKICCMFKGYRDFKQGRLGKCDEALHRNCVL